ncbi:unnamed protein product [Pleuronectes platessa]|uniref:Uncharacterized protein n=1 Tax=Pleuronectes platessa TaxID=8262 RepID=A0A9N7V784_PLEPL|nr:unnamed protein product [Pleuronectes platessa]
MSEGADKDLTVRCIPASEMHTTWSGSEREMSGKQPIALQGFRLVAPAEAHRRREPPRERRVPPAGAVAEVIREKGPTRVQSRCCRPAYPVPSNGPPSAPATDTAPRSKRKKAPRTTDAEALQGPTFSNQQVQEQLIPSAVTLLNHRETVGIRFQNYPVARWVSRTQRRDKGLLGADLHRASVFRLFVFDCDSAPLQGRDKCTALTSVTSHSAAARTQPHELFSGSHYKYFF